MEKFTNILGRVYFLINLHFSLKSVCLFGFHNFVLLYSQSPDSWEILFHGYEENHEKVMNIWTKGHNSPPGKIWTVFMSSKTYEVMNTPILADIKFKIKSFHLSILFWFVFYDNIVSLDRWHGIIEKVIITLCFLNFFWRNRNKGKRKRKETNYFIHILDGF